MKYHPDKASPLLADGTPTPDSVFVFFCNKSFKLGGATSKLAAAFGFQHPGVMGPGKGVYAIVTKDEDGSNIKEMKIIQSQIDLLKSHALANPHLLFFIQKPGKHEIQNEILAPLFMSMPDNVLAPQSWQGWTNSNGAFDESNKRACKSCRYRELRSQNAPASVKPIAQCAKSHDGIWLGENYICDQFEERV